MKRKVLKPELKLGAEPKKVMFLAALLVIAIGVYFWNRSDSPSNAAGATTAVPRPVPAAQSITLPRPGSRSLTRGSGRGQAQSGQARGGSLQEFKPTLKPKDPIDPSRVDPTLKLDLLARLKSVNIGGTGRSLFDFSGTPAAGPKVEITKVKPIMPGQIAGIVGPVEPKPPPPTPVPPPPPIPLKFYGFTNAQRAGHKRAFFLEGEDIFVAGEGDLIKNRYKVVRIGVNSADVVDTTNKHQQTLPLEAEQVST